METTLAILMVLGIFIGIPAIIGFTIVGMYLLSDRRARRAERAQSVMEAIAAAEHLVAEAQREQRAEVAGHQKTTKTTTVV